MTTLTTRASALMAAHGVILLRIVETVHTEKPDQLWPPGLIGLVVLIGVVSGYGILLFDERNPKLALTAEIISASCFLLIAVGVVFGMLFA